MTEEAVVEAEGRDESEFTEDEYIALRLRHDKNPDFKALRHRFWQLGTKRRFTVLNNLGLIRTGETLIEKVERYRLYKLREEGRENDLVVQIEVQEAEIRAENERAEYVSQKEPVVEDSGRAHAGRANLKKGEDHTVRVTTEPQPTENPWEL